jgi:hypothetical protein
MRRPPADAKRANAAAAAATDVENRRQLVADTLQLLQQRERRVQEAELCVSASYMFFATVLQELSARFKERNALQGPMEDEIKAAASLAVNALLLLLPPPLPLSVPTYMHSSCR